MKTSLMVLLLLAIALPAHAAKTKKKPPLNPGHEEETFIVKVPDSELEVASKLKESDEDTLSRVELGVSFWSPSHFSRPSFLPNATEFRSGSLPRLSLSRLGSLAQFNGNGAGIFWVAGIAYAQLEREASFAGLGSGQSATETLALVSLRAGISYQGPRFADKLLQPYASASLLPTYALASKTILEDRVSSWAFPLEATAGMLVRPSFMKDFWTFHDGALGVGAHQVFGKIDDASLSGLGVQATVSATL